VTVLLAAVALLAATLTAVPHGHAAGDAPVTRHQLENGLTVLVRESTVARVVAVSLQVDAGIASEPPDQAGITHFLQRVLVRGTSRRSAAEITALAADLGGAIEGSADLDHGEIRAHALSRHWESLLRLVADLALTPAFREEEVERARRLIVGQLDSRHDNPMPVAMDALHAELYGQHRYAIPATGRRQTIVALARDALMAHYRRVYRPERIVLAVSGDVPAARVTKLAERLFRTLPRGDGSGTPVPAVPDVPRSRRLVERPGQQAHIVVGYVGPSLADADHAATAVLTTVLGGGMSGRLFREVRERQGLAYSVGMSYGTRRGPAPLVAYVGTAPPNVEAAEAMVAAELRRITAEPPTDDEMERARARVLGALAMDRRTNARQAWYLAYHELAGVGWGFPDRYARAVEGVSASDVVAAARRYLDTPVTIVLQPAR
jgi:predicted Zn-dependent peptidase